MSAAGGERDAERLARFRAANPRIAVMAKQALPAAWADGRKLLTAPDLGALLDRLDEIFPPPEPDGG